MYRKGFCKIRIYRKNLHHAENLVDYIAHKLEAILPADDSEKDVKKYFQNIIDNPELLLNKDKNLKINSKMSLNAWVS